MENRAAFSTDQLHVDVDKAAPLSTLRGHTAPDHTELPPLPLGEGWGEGITGHADGPTDCWASRRSTQPTRHPITLNCPLSPRERAGVRAFPEMPMANGPLGFATLDPTYKA